mmetsp:Transcript_20602/g.31289  ORF Transcript_20602/g.31289 Transcript_20602/m.31289 type:complete len:546 (-) Transcript_20602:33-1670(-)|eukprot:CAMPEP_0194114378 /NCGR_PEP_ID=MMETSP0150-20130528/19913_1 /TAXON_ID=122233 /ORGANISM="Chaetoceros debilis, Strain MM31A-1" /LENGTH=545 /DNA_ID=CAMNT_0038804559 /DNA_START=108 /DNA_END=1745 /DNA_ORIENTATION=-
MRKRKTPIPSFSIKIDHGDAAGPSKSQKLETRSTHSNNTHTNNISKAAQSDCSTSATSDEVNYLSSLLQIEASIQLHKKSRRSISNRNASHTMKPSLSLDKFLAIIKKSTNANNPIMVEKLAAIYIMVATPTMISLDRNNMSLSFAVAETVADNGDQGQRNENNLEKLASLYRTKWDEPDWKRANDAKMRDLCSNIRKCKIRSSTKASGKARQAASIFSEDSSIITPGMTLEERVKARSKHSQELKKIHLKKASGAGHDDIDHAKNHSGESISRDEANAEHLVFADALRSYLRNAHNRSSRFQNVYKNTTMTQKDAQSISSSTNAKRYFRPMPLSDVCSHLVGVQSVGGRRKKYSKREVKNILIELTKLVPEWLKIVSQKSSTKGNRNRSVVFIKETTAYQSIRERLGGGTVRSVSQAQTSSNSNKSSAENSAHTTTENTKAVNDNDDVARIQKITKRKSKLSLSKQATSIIMPSASEHQSNGELRQQKDDASTKKSIPTGTLRVNHNQVMTDADYDGGEVLHSNTSNPRGLKRMFSQLNAGARI